jgi:hypothetical protein
MEVPMSIGRHVIFALVAACFFSFLTPVWGNEEHKGLSSCVTHLKALSQAVEIWANEHKGNFPTKEEWGSTAFMEMIRKSGAGTPIQLIKCPATGKPYLYTPLPAKKSYEIACPNPENHGLAILCYSRDRGLIKKEGETAATTSPKALSKPLAKPTKETPKKPIEKPSAKATPANVLPEEMTPDEKDKVLDVIKDLYNAYAERNLDKILALQKESIEASALDYEKKKKGSADDVREAFKGATKEIIEHKDFKMLPLNLSDITFQRKGNTCRITSVVPIIATERLEVMEEGKYFFVRLRIGELIFEKKNDEWKIVNMYLY